MAEEPKDTAHIDAALTSVAAHGMLNSLGVARATVATLRLHWSRLDEETCLRLLQRAEDQLTFLSDSLADLVRGIPAEARRVLDEIDESRHEPSDPPPAGRSSS
jgi:hypothetical protein